MVTSASVAAPMNISAPPSPIDIHFLGASLSSTDIIFQTEIYVIPFLFGLLFFQRKALCSVIFVMVSIVIFYNFLVLISMGLTGTFFSFSLNKIHPFAVGIVQKFANAYFISFGVGLAVERLWKRFKRVGNQ